MGDSSLLIYISCAIPVMLPLFWLLRSPNLSHIPTIAPSGFLGPCWTAIKFTLDGQKYLQEGYNRYKPRPFKIFTLRGWMVILNREHLEDVANIPESELSFTKAVNDSFKEEYTFGSGLHHDGYHYSILRSQLSRNLPLLCPDIKDEVVNAFSELLNITENGRDPGWNDFVVHLTAAIMKEVLILHPIPAFIVPWIARYVTGLDARTRKAVTYLGPMIQERQRHMGDKDTGKEWLDKPNDFLQWLLDAGRESSVTLLTQRMMSMNFSAIHTTSNTFTQALYHLAANPQYALLLREEVERIIEQYGWTKEALGKMPRVDSFLKETLRYEGVAWCTATSSLAAYTLTQWMQVTAERKVVKDIKLSDGTFLPKGTLTLVAKNGVHHDPGVYDNAGVFEPFRFADLAGDGEGYKYQFAAVNSASLSFGYGKTACPGRFFAAVMLKTMLAYTVLSFDVKLDESRPQPKSLKLGYSIVADPKARVMFRKRSA